MKKWKSKMNTLKRYLGLLCLFAKYSFMEQLEYRINFISGIAVECGYMLAKLMYVILVYQMGSEINGLTPDHMAMFIGTYIMMTGFYMAVYPNFCAIPQYVKTGSMDMLLTKPVNLQFMLTLRKIDFGMPIPNVICGVVLVCYGWKKSGLPVTVITVSGFLLFIVSGIFLTYFLFLIPKLLSFWIVSDQGIQQITEAVWDFNNMPMNIYGKKVRMFGTFVIPLFLITNFPTLFVMNRLSVFMVIWGVLAPFLFFAINKLVWKAAMKRYTSASS